MRKVAVLGLGRFGMRLARELAGAKVEVIAIDRNPDLIEQLKGEIEAVVALDVTQEVLLRKHGVGDVDVCVVAIGESFEVTVLATIIAQNMKIPYIVARAQTILQAEILKRIGADEIVQPEREAAEHLMRRLAYPQLEDFVELDDNHSLIQLHAPKAFHGHSLSRLELRRKYRVNLVAIKRPLEPADGEEPKTQFLGVPTADEIIRSGDTLILIGDHNALAGLPQE